MKVECEEGTVHDFYDSKQDLATQHFSQEPTNSAEAILPGSWPVGCCALGGYRLAVVTQPTLESIPRCDIDYRLQSGKKTTRCSQLHFMLALKKLQLASQWVTCLSRSILHSVSHRAISGLSTTLSNTNIISWEIGQ